MTTQQNEQQVGGGEGGQTAAFNEQAGPGYDQQNEQQVGGGHGLTGAFSEQAGRGYDRPVLREPDWGGTHGDGEHTYGTPVHEEPTHISSEEHSFEDAGHAAASEDMAAGHDAGADAGQEMHHG
jgi:hypothetical protein